MRLYSADHVGIKGNGLADSATKAAHDWLAPRLTVRASVDARYKDFRLCLVPKGQQRQYLHNDLPLPPLEQAMVGRSVSPRSSEREHPYVASRINQLSISEPVDLSHQPQDILHRLWDIHP